MECCRTGGYIGGGQSGAGATPHRLLRATEVFVLPFRVRIYATLIVNLLCPERPVILLKRSRAFVYIVLRPCFYHTVFLFASDGFGFCSEQSFCQFVAGLVALPDGFGICLEQSFCLHRTEAPFVSGRASVSAGQSLCLCRMKILLTCQLCGIMLKSIPEPVSGRTPV